MRGLPAPPRLPAPTLRPAARSRGTRRAGALAALALLAGLPFAGRAVADDADPAGAAPPPAVAARSCRYSLVIERGGERFATELDLHDLPAGRDGRRLVLHSLGEQRDLPFATLLVSADGRARPETSDPLERRVVDAILGWLEARGAIASEWLVAGSAGSERIRLPSLRLHGLVAVRRECLSLEGAPPVLRVSLETPVLQDGTLRVELRALEWTLGTDGAGEIRRAELQHEILRAVGGIEEREGSRITLELLASTELAPEDAAALAAETELLRRAARGLLPGQGLEAIAAAEALLAEHGELHAGGRLAAVVPPLAERLAARREELAGGTPDERAERLVGKIAPGFRLEALDGEPVDLEALRGRPVVLSFWGYT